jgi:hypothetical protein
MSAIDTELRDLLRDQPQLLRIAGAVAELPITTTRSRRFAPVAAIAAAAAIGLTVVVLALSSGHGPAIADRALAAIGTGPVIHAIVEYSSDSDVVVDLESGQVRERIHRTEYWDDAEHSLLHTRLLTDGKLLTEIVETPTGADSDLGHYADRMAPALDPALTGFATGYREALASGKARVVGHERLDGRDVTLLRIELDGGISEDVGVDSDTYRPLFFRTNPHEAPFVPQDTPTWRVVQIESVPRNSAYFAKPERSAARPTEGETHGSKELSAAEAANALDRPTFWVGPRFDSLPLARIELTQVKTAYTDGSTHLGDNLTLTYGEISSNGNLASSRPWLVVGQATSIAGSYPLGFNDGGDPPAPEGSIVLQHRGDWLGKLIRGGTYLQVSASSRELVLAAARMLEPMPTAS